GGAKEKSQASDANASRERDWLFEIVRRELPERVRRRAASSAVLILRSARAERVSQTRTGVRASRRMRLRYPSCFETHRSARMLGRRRARARCDAPQHEGARRMAHFGETKPMGSIACSIRAKPTFGCRKRSPAAVHCFGLLFTMNGATRTCDTGIWRTPKPSPREAGRGWPERSEGRVRGNSWGALALPLTRLAPIASR